jgi:hypothetical protein
LVVENGIGKYAACELLAPARASSNEAAGTRVLYMRDVFFIEDLEVNNGRFYKSNSIWRLAGTS